MENINILANDTTFDQQYNQINKLISDYCKGITKAEHFIKPLQEIQQFPDKLYVNLNWYKPVTIFSSYQITLTKKELVGAKYIFDLKNMDDISIFLKILTDQCYCDILVGANIGIYSGEHTKQSMSNIGFGDVYKRLYPFD